MDPPSLQVSSSSSNLTVNQSDGDRGRESGAAPGCRVKGVPAGWRTGEIDFELLSVEPKQKKKPWDDALRASASLEELLMEFFIFHVSQPFTTLGSVETIKIPKPQCKMPSLHMHLLLFYVALSLHSR